MAVVLTQRVSEDEIFGIWQITESEEDLRKNPDSTAWAGNMMEGVRHPLKRLEFLASRLLTEHLTMLLGLPFKGIYKDSHGKPHPITGDENLRYHLSLSHSYPFAASCIHLRKPVGIDIEIPREKLVRVSHKFIHEKEAVLTQNNNIDQLCIMWAAKEAIFKMNGRNGLSLKEDILIKEVKNTHKQVLAEVRINGKIEKVSIDYFEFNDNWIAFTR